MSSLSNEAIEKYKTLIRPIMLQHARSPYGAASNIGDIVELNNQLANLTFDSIKCTTITSESSDRVILSYLMEAELDKKSLPENELDNIGDAQHITKFMIKTREAITKKLARVPELADLKIRYNERESFIPVLEKAKERTWSQSMQSSTLGSVTISLN